MSLGATFVTRLQQVAENHSGESLVSFGFNQLLTGMDFRDLL
jgi:hypothetical protein